MDVVEMISAWQILDYIFFWNGGRSYNLEVDCLDKTAADPQLQLKSHRHVIHSNLLPQCGFSYSSLCWLHQCRMPQVTILMETYFETTVCWFVRWCIIDLTADKEFLPRLHQRRRHQLRWTWHWKDKVGEPTGLRRTLRLSWRGTLLDLQF